MTTQDKIIPFPVDIRTADFKDHAFIFGAWLESFKQDAKPGSWLSVMRWSNYRKLQTRIIDNAMNNGVVLVASLPDDKEHIIGFAIGTQVLDSNVLHYVYVRPNRRLIGLGTNLASAVAAKLGGPLLEYSHNTRAGNAFAQSLNLMYNPLTAISF